MLTTQEVLAVQDVLVIEDVPVLKLVVFAGDKCLVACVFLAGDLLLVLLTG